MIPDARVPDPAALLRRLRVQTCYAWRHGRPARLDRPTRFTELVQLRKLHDRDPRLPSMMDKLAAKDIAAAALGAEWVTPTLWAGTRLPPTSPFGFPAIVKARHGCNQNAVLAVPPAAQEWDLLRARADRWTARPYGEWLDEWAYREVPRGVLAEPLLAEGAGPPVDYKVYVFAGQATHVQIHRDRDRRHRWTLCDRAGRPLHPSDDRPRAPASLRAMLAAAEVLATGHAFLRVDFYEIGGRPRFGEFCLYPGSGLDRFAADWIDHALGALWLDALGPHRSAIGDLPAPAMHAGPSPGRQAPAPG